MTVSSIINSASYIGNGVTTAFSFPYKFLSQADIRVVETVIATGVQTEKALTTDFTISGTTDATGAYPTGGTVTAVVAPASTVTWTIIRDPAIKQLTQHIDNDPIPAASIDNPLDLLTIVCQRLAELLSRSLRQPDGDTTAIGELPAKVTRTSMLLGFDADGEPEAVDPASVSSTANIVSAFMATVLDDSDANAALTTLGAGATGKLLLAAASAAAATAILSAVVGDSGSGGTKGLVPAPASGDAAAGKALHADGTFKKIGSVLQFCGGTSIGLSSGTTLFIATGAFAGGEAVFVKIPVAGVISNLQVQSNTAPGSGKNFVFTVRKNASSNTTLTCTMNGTNTQASDTTHSATLAAGDFVCLKAVADVGATTTDAIWASVYFTPV